MASVSTNYAGFLAPSHLGFYVVAPDATTETTTRFRHYVGGSSIGLINNWTENFNSQATGSTTSMGMVVAPEPGTMIALGAGVAALLRRRKKNVK